MKQLIYLVYFLLIASSVMAQDSTIALRSAPRAIVKLAPLSLLDQDATIQAGLEYRTGVRTSVQAEIGYGWRGLSLFSSDLNEFVDAEVWRGRAEVRFYSGRYRTNRRQGIRVRSNFPLGNYWAIDGLFKQINVAGRAVQPIDLFSTKAEPYLGLVSSRYVLGTHLKIGRQWAFYDPQRRVFSRTLLDIYLGAGARWSTNDVRSNSGANMYDCGCGIGRSFTDTGSQVTPSITAGLKVGFAL
ncbi:hypothetical protein [Spirosoma arcticum]